MSTPETPIPHARAAAIEIRAIAEAWAVFRDSGAWDEFGALWHEGAWITTTWFQGSHLDFIEAGRRAWADGARVNHFLGGHTSAVNGARAVAQTKMRIEQRIRAHGVEVDVVCTGRFYDFLERRDGRWGIVRRQPIYEKDRLDVVDPSASITLDERLLGSLPMGYRHLGYVQTLAGLRVLDGLPGLRGAAVDHLYTSGRRWLAGTEAAVPRPVFRPLGPE
ncbi:nuclear transport factor 2 family protein [Streptomyces sp. SID8361]|uniref:nuclear transport factor 2 family protein n=1 Tax=Streptomyces TaxID=1883 RepID=UPI00081F2B8C|nr:MULTISPECIES: nuclear transport factor 2 family protein [Streptomyces]MYU09336.1 nuclear transport factor 2 family protein [Streptomyces sp. SID8361]ATL88262.1 PEP2 protein [Streptomyces malaysiensis]MCD9587065.1 nuclear transport factor 2 family protein [Streptomyces sp. 8ZJF_21]QDL68436.1 nuclear transport factor 2 family protein [Streptomyces malaysiensis]SCF60918.1 SnoaL-like domain-containing protein [Streptomyces sp. MnatMP-M27]